MTIATLAALTSSAQTEVTAEQAKTMYAAKTKRVVSVHDPSVVYDASQKRYYIFGSHKAGAYTTDFQNWTQANPTWSAGNANAFTTPAVKTVKKGGQDVAFPQFNAFDWSKRSDASYNIDGNMWAPDVVWNPTMQKWCFYLSVNGDLWHSSIVLLTSDNITGPYTYQGPVVCCGFKDSEHSYKETDLELVLGTQTSLPARYNVGNNWGRRWPHTIDPAVFYDEEGKLWLVYGSWSGGIWMLELDEKTGLRDYDVTYPSTNGNSDGVTSDPYFGKKVAGGFYVSGEGPYIEHIGKYYYLFVSYGGFAPDGGYEMRIFRSEKPDGPYVDGNNRSAIFDKYLLNYGLNRDGSNSDKRGEKILGAYNNWGFQTTGECAQGHNSIIAAEDGRTYLVYHTKFNDGTLGHLVRVHQVFVNEDGWLVAAPFEYNGEQTTDAQIASQQTITPEDAVGTYQLLVHKYCMDHANYEEVTPLTISLNADKSITGDRKGSWIITEGTNYITVTLTGIVYHGVIVDEVMDGQTIHALAITACNKSSGTNIWAYKMRDDYAIAWQLNNYPVPVKDNQTISLSTDLYSIANANGPAIQWTSSMPEVISNEGRYNPTGLSEDADVELTLDITQNRAFFHHVYNVKAKHEEMPTADWQTGLLAHYGFDGGSLANTYNAAQVAVLEREKSTALPTLADDLVRNGKIVNLAAGANGAASYVKMENPFYGAELTEGCTISFWTRLAKENLWDALLGFHNPDDGARFYLTGNAYIGYNSNKGNWIDINHPENITTDYLPAGQWHFVTLIISRTGGITLYVDGSTKKQQRWKGSYGGTSFSTENKRFGWTDIVDHITRCQYVYLGNGSFWGSPEASFDDVCLHNRPLKYTEQSALRQMCGRVYNWGDPSGIASPVWNAEKAADAVYDLQGRRLNRITNPGLYLVGGKKIVVK